LKPIYMVKGKNLLLRGIAERNRLIIASKDCKIGLIITDATKG